MNMNPKYLLSLIILAIAAAASSCTSNLPETSTTPNASPPTSTQNNTQREAKLNNIQSPTDTSKAASSKTENVTLYTSDVQCQELLPQKVTVPATESVTSAVGKIIEEQETADLSLSGYRVNVKNGIATVDLRLSPQSKRQFTSLSSCEQFALFGSLRKTLTSNSQWKIQEVRFTEQGEEIIL
ncbi:MULTISPECIES: GerMN domain-containing protein [unclassified Anabaena]|uniref:GerMN domain-containing protein n=1 Tax=unclassified Anabaena TaxID=2619674 RepID=UPI000831AC96|nr:MULTISPECIES: GerMN domain-containing protein [unclassified Anabaena]